MTSCDCGRARYHGAFRPTTTPLRLPRSPANWLVLASVRRHILTCDQSKWSVRQGVPSAKTAPQRKELVCSTLGVRVQQGSIALCVHRKNRCWRVLANALSQVNLLGISMTNTSFSQRRSRALSSIMSHCPSGQGVGWPRSLSSFASPVQLHQVLVPGYALVRRGSALNRAGFCSTQGAILRGTRDAACTSHHERPQRDFSPRCAFIDCPFRASSGAFS
jgi:hypothetical protein